MECTSRDGVDFDRWDATREIGCTSTERLVYHESRFRPQIYPDPYDDIILALALHDRHALQLELPSILVSWNPGCSRRA
jgi:hypothetical protein